MVCGLQSMCQTPLNPSTTTKWNRSEPEHTVVGCAVRADAAAPGACCCHATGNGHRRAQQTVDSRVSRASNLSVDVWLRATSGHRHASGVIPQGGGTQMLFCVFRFWKNLCFEFFFPVFYYGFFFASHFLRVHVVPPPPPYDVWGIRLNFSGA